MNGSEKKTNRNNFFFLSLSILLLLLCLQELGHLGGPEKEDVGVLGGAEAEPKRREAGGAGAGRGGGVDGVVGSKELRRGVR